MPVRFPQEVLLISSRRLILLQVNTVRMAMAWHGVCLLHTVRCMITYKLVTNVGHASFFAKERTSNVMTADQLFDTFVTKRFDS